MEGSEVRFWPGQSGGLGGQLQGDTRGILARPLQSHQWGGQGQGRATDGPMVATGPTRARGSPSSASAPVLGSHCSLLAPRAKMMPQGLVRSPSLLGAEAHPSTPELSMDCLGCFPEMKPPKDPEYPIQHCWCSPSLRLPQSSPHLGKAKRGTKCVCSCREAP